MSNIDASADRWKSWNADRAHSPVLAGSGRFGCGAMAVFLPREVMVWCEREGMDYIFGLAQNERLKKQIARRWRKPREQYLETKAPALCSPNSSTPPKT